MPTPTETYLVNLLEQLPAITADSIVSRTLYTDAQVKTVLFGFAAGQSLSEHTAGTPAIIQIIQGEATLTIGAASQRVGPGAYAHLPARQPHSLEAHTPIVMLLQLLRAGAEPD